MADEDAARVALRDMDGAMVGGRQIMVNGQISHVALAKISRISHVALAKSRKFHIFRFILKYEAQC